MSRVPAEREPPDARIQRQNEEQRDAAVARQAAREAAAAEERRKLARVLERGLFRK